VRRGHLIVIAGPSGVGKGSIVSRLLARDPEGLAYSVSATTRPAREGEQDGVDYHFLDAPAFERMIEGDGMLEWATYAGSLYGTPRAFVEEHLDQGRDVLLEIEVQGAAQIRERVPEAVLILVEPPSFEVLEARLRGRGTEEDRAIETRLAAARQELAQAPWFHHVIVNDDLERASGEVAAIIEASRTP
jgi:guanylate kinase